VGFTGSALLWSARQMAAAAQGTANAAVNAALCVPRTALWAAGSVTGLNQAPAAASSSSSHAAMPKLPARAAAKGSASAGGAAAAGPGASVAVTVSAGPGGWSVLSVLRLMFWQLPWSVAVASLTAWSWLLSQLVVAPAASVFNWLTQAILPTGVTSATTAAPEHAVAVVPAPSVVAAGGQEAAEEEQQEAVSPRVGGGSRLKWLRRGRAAGQVPPTPAPSLEVRALLGPDAVQMLQSVAQLLCLGCSVCFATCAV
jgi:hypothetical protein